MRMHVDTWHAGVWLRRARTRANNAAPPPLRRRNALQASPTSPYPQFPTTRSARRHSRDARPGRGRLLHRHRRVLALHGLAGTRAAAATQCEGAGVSRRAVHTTPCNAKTG